MTSLSGKITLREIEPHAAGFAQGFLIPGGANYVFSSEYVFQGVDGSSDFDGAFDRIAAAISRRGLSLSDTVAMTIMLSRPEDTARFRQVRISRLAGRLPASTLVIVDGFADTNTTAVIDIVSARPL